MTCATLTTACTTADATIHQAAVAPYALRYDVTSTSGEFDLSTVTAGEFHILRGNGSEDTWSAGISNQTATSLRLTHVFISTDVPDVETVVVEPHLTTPSGVLVCEPKTLRVREKFT